MLLRIQYLRKYIISREGQYYFFRSPLEEVSIEFEVKGRKCPYIHKNTHQLIYIISSGLHQMNF